MARLNTIPDDIYRLFDESMTHTPTEENLNALAENIKDLMRNRFKARSGEARPLRFSALGKPDRQLWYEAHPIEGGKEALRGPTYIKFLYGDLIEQMLLFLVKEAGHEVTDEQEGVVCDGVTGSIDAIIDGVVVDVKSASPYGYKKFENNGVVQDDPFGYVAQLSGYSNILKPGDDAAWLAMDKVSGEVCISVLPHVVIKHHQPQPRIEHLKEVIKREEPPELCYEPVEDGKSGNFKLPTGCSYCSHKFRCHPSVRTFIYSNGPRFLTTVARVPDVIEIT